MKNTGTTVVKNKGHLIPQQILAQCLQNQTSLGVAVQEGEAFDVQRHRVTLTKENANIINEGLKDKDCVLFFQTGANPEHEDDVAPFVLLEDTNSAPILLCYIDGNIDRSEDSASSHNALHNAASEIRQRVKRFYSQHNGNLKETLTDIYQDELFAKDILQMFDGDRGTVTFWGVNEDPFHFTVSTDETVLNLDSCWCSNFGTVAKTEEAPASGLAGLFNKVVGKATPAPAKVEPKLENKPAPAQSLRQTAKPAARSTVREAYSSTSSPAPDVAPAAKPDGGTPAVPAQPGTSVPAVGLPDPEEVLTLEVPNHVRSKHGKHSGWVRKRTPGGILPPDWKNLKAVIVKRKDATSAFMNDYERQNPSKLQKVSAIVDQPKIETPKAATAIPASATAKEKPVTAGSAARPDRHAVSSKHVASHAEAASVLRKDVSTHEVGQKDKGILAGPIPLLAPGAKAKFLSILESADFKNAVDRQAQAMSDPQKWKELEDKIPDIAAQLGLKSLRDTDAWPYEYLLKIGKDVGIEALAIISANWRSEAMHWQHFADQLMGDKNDTSGTGNVVQEPVKATGTDGKAVEQRRANLQKQAVERTAQSTSLRHSVQRRAM